MSDFSVTKFFRNQYLSEGDIKLRPYDLRNHPDVKILADTIGKMLDVEVEADLGSGSYNGREGYYIKMPRYGFQYWSDETKAIAKAALDKASELSKEFDFEFNDVSDYDIEPGERDWPANIGFFIKEKESIEENLKNYIKVSEPSFRKDKNNPNFLSAYIKYDTGGGGALMAFGQETMSGQIRRLSSAEAVRQMEIIAKKLKDNFDIEDIEVTDLENGVVELFAVSDDFIDMDPKSELSMALLNEGYLERAIENEKDPKKLAMLKAKKEFFDNTPKEKRRGMSDDEIRKAINKLVKEDINDPVLVKARAAKMAADKLAKMRAANAGDDGNDKFFDNAKKIAFLKKEREQLMRDMEQEAEPEGGPIADEYGDKLNKIDAAIAKLSGRKEMTYDQAIAEEKSLKKGDIIKFKDGSSIYILGPKGDGYDYKDGREKGHHPKGWFDMMISSGKAVVAEMKVGDKVTFKSGGGDMEIIDVRDMFASDLKAYRVKNADGETFEYSEDQLQLAESSSSEEKRIAMRAIRALAKYRGVSKEEARNDLMRAAKELGSFSEAIKDIKETIELGKNLTEELCAAGKAYRKRRMAAGEKSSAYLSGRAVKVCKGQMSGRKKKKK